MIKIAMFSDLDGSMIYGKDKFTQDEEKIAMSWLNGENLMFSTKAQHNIYSLFKESCEYIPVTARSKKNFFNTHFSKDKHLKHYVVSLGAEITIHNEVDEEWSQNIKNLYEKYNINLSLLFEQLKNLFKNEKHIKIETNDDFFVKIKYPKSNKEETLKIVKRFEHLIDREVLDIVSQKKKIVIKPFFLNKEEAVKYMIKKLNIETTIGIGDNHYYDGPFLELMDFKLFHEKMDLI